MKKQTMTRRFYPTGSAVDNPEILKTMNEALLSARNRVESSQDDEVYIVEVVRIVRRTTPTPPPIEVIEVD